MGVDDRLIASRGAPSAQSRAVPTEPHGRPRDVRQAAGGGSLGPSGERADPHDLPDVADPRARTWDADVTARYDDVRVGRPGTFDPPGPSVGKSCETRDVQPRGDLTSMGPTALVGTAEFNGTPALPSIPASDPVTWSTDSGIGIIPCQQQSSAEFPAACGDYTGKPVVPGAGLTTSHALSPNGKIGQIFRYLDDVDNQVRHHVIGVLCVHVRALNTYRRTAFNLETPRMAHAFRAKLVLMGCHVL